ncbi:unnamed protein product [Rotaria sp. Silwood1]|nr:unnamed protein product [Rotaria sp. Silwood1]CAF3481690.1 unnamed protein product [Rotaria sp. Silwood1]CAF5080941.1 unnamed protein product [Rotaria sp. Silwood1]
MSTGPPPSYNDQDSHKNQPPQMSQPVYVGSPVIIVGEYPTQCTCPQCGKQIVTRTQKKSGMLAWIICAVLFFTLLWLCCWIPFCVDACKDTQHYCPNCGTLLGVKKQI